MLDVNDDCAGGAVVSEVLDEIHQVEAGLVAGRDRVGGRQVAPFEGLAQMAHEAATLRDHRQRRIAFARNTRHHRGMRKSGSEAVDVVGIAKAIGTEQRDIARACHLGEFFLGRPHVFADLGKARREDDRRPHLATHAAGERLLHTGRRQREDREIDAFGNLVHALAHRPAVDLGSASDQMNVARVIVDLQVGEHRLPGRTGLARYADDRHRARPHQPPNCGSAACTGMHFHVPRSVVISRCKCSISGAPSGSKSGRKQGERHYGFA